MPPFTYKNKLKDLSTVVSNRLNWETIFVSATHQTGLGTRSLTRRSIMMRIYRRWRSGTSRGSSPAGLCWSSAHFVQCGPDEPSWTWTQIWDQVRIPNYSLNWTARSSAIQEETKVAYLKPVAFWPQVCHWPLTVRHRCQTVRWKVSAWSSGWSNSVKLRVVLKSNELFPLNLKDSVTAHQKPSLIYRLTCKCDVYYTGCTNQRLEQTNIFFRISEHILLTTRRRRAVIIQLPPLAAIYWPIRPSRAYTVPLCLPSWRHMNCSYPFWKYYLFKKKTELCIQKQSYTPLLFNNLLGPSEENIVTAPSLFSYSGFFFSICFSPLTPRFSFAFNPMFTFSNKRSIVNGNSLKRSGRKKGSSF